jgi:sigma-E factor negative regulatory protein RseA
MSKESLEHLSSLMDGEVSREAGSFLTRRLSSDEEMCEAWERYHLIRDCIRQPGSKQAVMGLSAKLNAAMDAEELPKGSPLVSNRWIKPVSGLAIAASVALMAIVVSGPQTGALPAMDPVETPVVNKPFVSPNTLALTPALTPATQTVSYSPAEQARTNRLNAYLLRHNQMARTAGRQGFVSFVPIVATPVASAAEQSGDDSEAEKTGPESASAKNK